MESIWRIRYDGNGMLLCWGHQDRSRPLHSRTLVLVESWLWRQKKQNSHGLLTLRHKINLFCRDDYMWTTQTVFQGTQRPMTSTYNLLWAFDCPAIVWKDTDSDIILLADFNENIYTGQISKHLALADLMLSKQCLQCTGMHVPPTFGDGTVLIDAIFATAVIKCVNAYILPHKGEMGDHWCFILNFMSSSVIGTKFPNIVCCSARKLHCKSKRLVQSNNAELDMLCNHHKMYQRN